MRFDYSLLDPMGLAPGMPDIGIGMGDPAVEATLFKLFAPQDGEPETGSRQVHRVLLLEMAGGEITSVAADADHGFVYVAGPTFTWAWAGDRVAPLFPMGGQVHYRGGTLTIASPESRQLVLIRRPATRAREMLRGAPPGVVPPAGHEGSEAGS